MTLGFSFSGRSRGSFPEQRLVKKTRRPAVVFLLRLVYSCCPAMSGIIKVVVSFFRKGEEVAIDVERHRSRVPADKEKHKGVFELKKKTSNRSFRTEEASPSVLQYAQDFATIVKESLKRTSRWAAKYYTHDRSYYPVPQSATPLSAIAMMALLPGEDITPGMEEQIKELLESYRPVRQRTVRSETTKDKAWGLATSCLHCSTHRQRV